MVTEDRLLPVLEQLKRREPLLHRRDLVGSVPDVYRETAEDYWEVGASGQRYSREYVVATLRERFESGGRDAYEAERWELTDFQLREIAPATYLLTYTLRQPDRLTRRLTVWQGSETTGWKIHYHQGTVVT
jgi:hypothetical protein